MYISLVSGVRDLFLDVARGESGVAHIYEQEKAH